MSLPNTDHRLSDIVDWLENSLSLAIQHIEPASGDASFRRYFRVRHAAGQHIVMDAPPEKENILPFIRVAGLFRKAGLHVPVIHEENTKQGFLLLEDLGSERLLDRVRPENASQLYGLALDSLFTFQTGIDAGDSGLPAYDAALFERELGVFHEWFLEKLLGLVLPANPRHTIHQVLIDSALAQPRVCVHRDYHSRNLMTPDDNGPPGILDFQDAVIGPISYDPVSLLRDCYINWPQDRIEDWLSDYHRRLLTAGLLTVDFGQFTRWFDLMGLQRHLKAIGIFSRLHLRDGKSAYLADIPRTMSYVLEVCEKYPELAEFNGFLQRQVLPIYRAAL